MLRPAAGNAIHGDEFINALFIIFFSILRRWSNNSQALQMNAFDKIFLPLCQGELLVLDLKSYSSTFCAEQHASGSILSHSISRYGEIYID